VDIKSFDSIVLPDRRLADEPTYKTARELREACKTLKSGCVAFAGGIANGRLVGVKAGPGGVSVAHGLGRSMQGYVVVSSSASAVFHNSVIGAGSTFTLFSSVTTDARVWVF
jgi:hypothetical protein